jgi:hypothetical protein
MRVDESGDHRAAAKIDRLRIGCDGHLLADPGDAAVPDRQRGGDDAPAVDELAVREDQVLVSRSLDRRGRCLRRRDRAATGESGRAGRRSPDQLAPRHRSVGHRASY